MANRFYSADEQRAGRVRRLFATIAGRYDLLNDLMSLGLHRRWKQRLVAAAGRPARVLDLCCGTGDLARRFAAGGARVCGVDFTGEMLQVARSRPQNSGSAGASPSQRRIAWLQGDALRLPFADDAFDVVSVGYGLRNLADLETGLREIRRVLRPGGQLWSLDFGKPESALWRGAYLAYLGIALPGLGLAFHGDKDTYGYILTSLRQYPAQRGLRDLMTQCGYQACGFTELWGGAMAINFGSKPG